MRKYNIKSNLISVIKKLYNKATSALFCNNNIGDWFRTTVGMRQRCLLSPTLFNILLERITTDALEYHLGIVGIGGRPITTLRFAGDMDRLAGNVHVNWLAWWKNWTKPHPTLAWRLVLKKQDYEQQQRVIEERKKSQRPNT
ncbi:endonuclease-reverse transcriptase [Elysia marginata]|uniref:Endonuclease-reverse transcriptase n=1 Tax=Elysia marginata TaxID=1093978 RepID=A0AAV4G3Z5_9GAST|nr:endonuclease-reverse transcriptase [Elysia marginata]